ncbi:protein OSCP1 isoform X2 [Neocloeon triangulifer]|uniref:protein OSCP1 isoform X2 n=1 Tax=Neocloeon triangulifer TaxID=2078957 RepID=UPI00286F2029|nr:protein OSCP1 isoform X2 [Neocloeon triangulifer]
MTDRTLPLLFVNLGGEMLYIIEDRLTTQQIAEDKTRKVLHDIVATMLNERFVEELFKPQKLSNRHGLRTLFDNLAHVSIMRLNRTSMNKLYDLMISVVKYQIYSISRPQDLLLVTMNHLEALAGKEPTNLITRLIANYHTKFIQTYATMQNGELQLLRNFILNYLQDDTVRVSVLLKDRSQNPDGRFFIPTSGPVASGCEVPVIIRSFSDDGNLETEKVIKSPYQFDACLESGSLGLFKSHVTTLGLNIYHAERRMEEKPIFVQEDQRAFNPDSFLHATNSPLCAESSAAKGQEKGVGYQELHLLSKLLHSDSNSHSVESGNFILLDLFNSDGGNNIGFATEDQHESKSPASPALVVDARNQDQTQELAALFNEMNVLSHKKTHSGSTEDLLDLIPSSS